MSPHSPAMMPPAFMHSDYGPELRPHVAGLGVEPEGPREGAGGTGVHQGSGHLRPASYPDGPVPPALRDGEGSLTKTHSVDLTGLIDPSGLSRYDSVVNQGIIELNARAVGMDWTTVTVFLTAGWLIAPFL